MGIIRISYSLWLQEEAKKAGVKVWGLLGLFEGFLCCPIRLLLSFMVAFLLELVLFCMSIVLPLRKTEIKSINEPFEHLNKLIFYV